MGFIRRHYLVIRSIIAALLCTIWLYPLWMSVAITLDALAWLEDHVLLPGASESGEYPFGSISSFAVARWLFGWATILFGMTWFTLMVVIFHAAWKTSGKKWAPER
jgi:hypothetical protein